MLDQQMEQFDHCWCGTKRKGYEKKRFRRSGAMYFYRAQVAHRPWSKGKIHPDAASALAALFAPIWRKDVALLVRMTRPHQLPETLDGMEIYVAEDGVLRCKCTNEVCARSHWEFRDEFIFLRFMCRLERHPDVALVGIGILPPEDLIPKTDFGSVLTLAGNAAFPDVYELLLRRCRAYTYSLEVHAEQLLQGIGTQAMKFRFLKSLHRKFPEVARVVVPLPDHPSSLTDRSDWTRTSWCSYNYLASICGFGDAEHLGILRALFAEFPCLRISTVHVYAAFGNASFSGSSFNQPDPLLRLVCEELPHSTPTLLPDCRHGLLLRVATFVDREERAKSYEKQLNVSSPQQERLSPPSNQFLKPRDTLKVQQLFAGRVRYVVRHLKVKPDATTLRPILTKDKELFNELATGHQALHNSCYVKQELSAAVYQMRDDIFFSPSVSTARLGRMEQYVDVTPNGGRY